MTNTSDVEKILDYWITMGFLNQSNFDTSTDWNKRKNKIRDYKKTYTGDKIKPNQYTVAIGLNFGNNVDIYSEILKSAYDCEMRAWGKLTFYVGRIKRQECIEKIAVALGSEISKNFKENQIEKDSDEIAMLSFQCEPDGTYVRNSFSLSPILWAISQINKKSKDEVSGVLSKEAYEKTMQELQKQFFPMGDFDSDEEHTTNEENEEGSARINEQDEVQRFLNDSVSIDHVNSIYRYLIENYGGVTFKEKTKPPLCITKYTLFKNAEEKKKRDNDDEYAGLIQDFYSDDLSMVKSALINKTADFESGMLSDLIAYIRAPHDAKVTRKRHDFVHPESSDVFFDEMFKILYPKNTPLGKWPSRYRPAFMQQVAINLAMSEIRESFFGENGKVFSVNGPPGTGKTTLLKEIIANNIVEKANLLCEYDNPNDAFIEVAYIENNNCYRLEKDKILDYGILVVSNNNVAVENVTKEIPVEKGLSDLNSLEDDSPETKAQLEKIKKLFSKVESDQKIRVSENGKTEEYRDVYFTRYAEKLFGRDKENTSAWGLIAAPLGRKQNVSDFAWEVLISLVNDRRNVKDSDGLKRYHDAREKFVEKLNQVQKIQRQLCERADTVYKTRQRLRELVNLQKTKETEFENALKNLSNYDEGLKKCQEQEALVQSELDNILTKCGEIENNIEQLKCDIKTKDDVKDKYTNMYIEMKKNTGTVARFFMKIFQREKYNRIRDLENSYLDNAIKCDEEKAKIENLLRQEEDEKGRQENLKQSVSLELSVTLEKLKQIEDKKTAEKNYIQRLQAEIEDIEIKKKECECLFVEYRSNWGSTFDDDFVSNILSNDDARSTKAQVENPWTTEQFDREREELFYLALQVTREFVINSSHCMHNLEMLGDYWNNHFTNAEDKRAMADSLLQTLFLLTPVISSTFASVGKMFRDVVKPNTVGMLVIDEAGQAAPQYAIGAMFRSRKAIIVGDPKQVEPVVTDDLDLLKSIYTAPVYKSYKDKSLSVQKCADYINPFGTWLYANFREDEWIGCPLLVHRRCISPMYEISNSISYNGIMKQQTTSPSEEEAKRFISVKSRWINVVGTEIGDGNHYVQKQGEWILTYVKKAFKNNEGLQKIPSLFIISPFKSIVSSICDYLDMDIELHAASFFCKWKKTCIGTIHTFQGKEANEVIFVLGCDERRKYSKAVTDFVNSNMVNVAVTRAKYRLYIVGDMNTWQKNQYVMKAKSLIDILPIKRVAEILNKQAQADQADAKERLLEEASMEAQLLPDATSFVSETNEVGNVVGDRDKYSIDSKMFVSSIDEQGFLKEEIRVEQYRKFGFSKETFEMLPPEVKSPLLMGMKLYFLLDPIYQVAPNLDTSCCGILFCRAMEAYLRINFVRGLQQRFSSSKIWVGRMRKLLPLPEVPREYFMIGKICQILDNNKNKIVTYMAESGKISCSVDWWESFCSKLRAFGDERNNCCHPSRFDYDNIKNLLKIEFETDDESATRNPKIGGIFFESEVGKTLEDSSC